MAPRPGFSAVRPLALLALAGTPLQVLDRARALLPHTSEHDAAPFCEPRPRPTRGMAEEGQARGEDGIVSAARRLVAPNCNPARIKWSVPAR